MPRQDGAVRCLENRVLVRQALARLNGCPVIVPAGYLAQEQPATIVEHHVDVAWSDASRQHFFALLPSGVVEHLAARVRLGTADRSEEQTSELQSLMRISYAVFCLNNKKTQTDKP